MSTVPLAMRDSLTQMLALLEQERQALASLDLERILSCASGKEDICARLDASRGGELDDECRGLLDAVKRLNDVNRKLRNLIAANIQARLGTLTGTADLYARSPGGATITDFPR